MNRTLLSAILVIALTAMNCFAAETQQVAATAANPAASLPAASQALAIPAPSPQPQSEASAVSGQAEKSSPIVEADSRQDGIAPQKSQLGEATPAQMQAANASAAGAVRPSLSSRKIGTNVGGTAPKMRVVSQTTPPTASTEARKLGTSTGTKSTEGGCQSCKKKRLISGDNTPAPETTK